GIATQDPELRRKFSGQPEHVVNYLFMVAEEARQWTAELGFRSIDEMVGRCDALEPNADIQHWKTDGIDLSGLLEMVYDPATQPAHKTEEQDHELDGALDYALIEQARPALQRGEPVVIDAAVGNTDRVVGTMLSHAI